MNLQSFNKYQLQQPSLIEDAKFLNTQEFRNFAIKHQGISGSNVDRYVHSVENMTRSVIEERQMRFAEVDVFSRLMVDRIIFVAPIWS